MARTETKALELGFQAPNFNLWDVTSDKSVSLNDLKSDKATVIMFICNHCPFVKHVNTEIVRLAKDYQPKGISFIAISSNDVDKYPDDSPEQMKITAQHEGYTFPYLYDETQETAKAYDAVCTPEFYIFDKNLKCVYHGQLDDSRPNSEIPVTGKDIRSALEAILAGELVNPSQKPSLGCNIKWKQ